MAINEEKNHSKNQNQPLVNTVKKCLLVCARKKLFSCAMNTHEKKMIGTVASVCFSMQCMLPS